MQLISMKKACELTSLSRTQVGRLEGEGDFPKRLKPCPGRIAYVLQEVLEWIADRANRR